MLLYLLFVACTSTKCSSYKSIAHIRAHAAGIHHPYHGARPRCFGCQRVGASTIPGNDRRDCQSCGASFHSSHTSKPGAALNQHGIYKGEQLYLPICLICLLTIK